MSSLLNDYVFTSLDVYGVALYKLYIGRPFGYSVRALAALGHDGPPPGLERRFGQRPTEWQQRNELALNACVRAVR